MPAFFLPFLTTWLIFQVFVFPLLGLTAPDPEAFVEFQLAE